MTELDPSYKVNAPTTPEFQFPDGRRARQLEVEDELGNPATIIALYNGKPQVLGDTEISVLASEAWVFDLLAKTGLQEDLHVAAFPDSVPLPASYPSTSSAKSPRR